MASAFYTFYICGLSYLGLFSPLLCLMCLPTQFPFPFLIWSLLCPSSSKHLINAYIMKTGNHVYILCKRKENLKNEGLFSLQLCGGCFTPSEASGFLPSFYICSGQTSLSYDSTLHSWNISSLVTSKKDLIGACMLIPGQTNHKMRNLFLSHLLCL